LLRGYQVPTDKTQTTVKPGQQGQFGLSDIQKIGGLASILGGTNASALGLTSEQLSSLGSLWNSGINNVLPYFNPSDTSSPFYVANYENEEGAL
jgi:hypothetical protein